MGGIYMSKNIIMVLLILLTAIIATSAVSAGLFDSDKANSDLNVTDISIKDEGYSMYEVSCQITPKKDFKYLGMIAIFYDSDDAVIEKSSYLWNTNEPAKDQLIKVSGTAYISGNEKPVRAEVYFVDSALNTDTKDALYSENVTI